MLKSAAHFRAALKQIATKVIEVDASGINGTDLSRFNYRHLRRPIYPLDADTRWEPLSLPTREGPA